MQHHTNNTNEQSLLAAEYVLGALDPQAQAAFEARLATDSQAQDDVAYWENQLADVGLTLPAVTPPASVWRGIQMQTGVRSKPLPCNKRVGRWAHRRWLKWSAAASVAAIALTLMLLVSHQPAEHPIKTAATAPQQLPDTLPQGVEALPWASSGNATRPAQLSPDFVGKIQDYASSTGWRIAGYNQRSALRVVATGKPYTQLWEASTLELWLLPVNSYEEPISLGLLPVSGEREIPIPQNVASEFYTDYNKLAVSIEPPGGSTTGEPTGNILFITTLTRALGE